MPAYTAPLGAQWTRVVKDVSDSLAGTRYVRPMGDVWQCRVVARHSQKKARTMQKRVLLDRRSRCVYISEPIHVYVYIMALRGHLTARSAECARAGGGWLQWLVGERGAAV